MFEMGQDVIELNLATLCLESGIYKLVIVLLLGPVVQL